MTSRAVAVSALAATLTGIASADFYGTAARGYEVTATDFGGNQISAWVLDIYLLSDDAWEGTSGSGDTLLNIYHWNAEGGPSSYYQSLDGAGWIPTNAGGPFDTEALRTADSFVTIGGFDSNAEQAPGAGAGVGVDPDFGGNNAAAPGPNAGWYNGSPPSFLGGATDTQVGIGVLIGRFASLEGEFWFDCVTFGATWNQGLGTPAEQGDFVACPSPGSLALLGAASIFGSRRRRAS